MLIELGLESEDESVDEEVGDLFTTVDTSLAKMELRRMMSGEHDSANAIIEVHAGAGGTDAQDWADMLLRMYTRWCERAGLALEQADLQPGEEVGLKSATLIARGDYAYGWLRAEEGVHRLVRISPFDSNSRRHTAFAAVRITPELEDDIDVAIDWEKDVREDRFHASGAGGQHVNKTESAIRLTHGESGIVVQCQTERSQHKNRATARKILMSRLYDYLEAQMNEERSKIGSTKLKIEWGSQIRSYVNHPYRMVKDHRTGHEVSNLDAVLDGDLDGFMEQFLLQSGPGGTSGDTDKKLSNHHGPVEHDERGHGSGGMRCQVAVTAHCDRVTIHTDGRSFVDITDEVNRIVEASGIVDGLANACILHTSASLVVTENADPDVRRDLETYMSDLVKDGDRRFRHTAEGPDDMASHVRSVLTATSLSLPVRGGRLSLGTWQGLYVWEHRRANHRRNIEVTVV